MFNKEIINYKYIVTEDLVAILMSNSIVNLMKI